VPLLDAVHKAGLWQENLTLRLNALFGKVLGCVNNRAEVCDVGW
jgi:hypothetical protein